jgi:E3 ubiquitin-protein ligase UBR1
MASTPRGARSVARWARAAALAGAHELATGGEASAPVDAGRPRFASAARARRRARRELRALVAADRAVLSPDAAGRAEEPAVGPAADAHGTGRGVDGPEGPLAARLVDLPVSYTDLHMSLARRCVPAHPDRRPKNPALCLVCGEFLCAGSDCCRDAMGRGACTRHVQDECSGSTGLVLLVRQGMILLMRGGRAWLEPSPYVDDHGESLNGRNHGRPLFLDASRWEGLRRQFGEHSIAASVTRNREAATRVIRQSYY